MRIIVPAAFAAATLLSACSGHIAQLETDSSGRTIERIYNNMGGLVAVEARSWIARQREHDIAHYVIDGTCASYCSFAAFTHPGTCYTKSARVGVHPASIGGVVETTGTKRITNYYVARWPEGLRRWWAANRPTVLGRDLTYPDLKQIIPDQECGAEFQ